MSRPDRVTSVQQVRHGRQKRRSVWRVAARFIAASVAVIAVSATCIAGWAVTDIVSTTVSKGAVALPGESPGGVPDIGALEGGVNVLAIGNDSREGQGGRYGDASQIVGQRSDVVILLHIAQDHSNAALISFPRDMLVPIPSCPKTDESGAVVGEYPSHGVQKLNSSFVEGGIPCTVKTIELLTGIDVHFAAAIQFEGVVTMANALGGVEVCIAAPIHDPKADLDLPAGMVTLEGREAVQFLRTRHGVGDGSDLGRISNQQVYMSALLRKLQDAGTLANPVTLYSLAKVASSSMRFSEGLNNPNTMVGIAMAMKDIPAMNIAFVQYPTYYSDPDHLYPSEQAGAALVDAVKADKSLVITGGTGPGAVEGDDSTDAADGESAPPSSTPSTSPPASDSAAELPDGVQGQTGAEETCSKGRG